jgi:hypothetical protein
MAEKYSFKVLKKKIEKVDAMLKELDPSDEKHRKMGKKREQYMSQLKETPEWETEGALIERKERLMREAKRLRQAARETEEKRHKREEAEENERSKNLGAREEARRMIREKREKEEARRKAEKEAKVKAEEEARKAEEEARKAKEARFREREERERREIQEREERERREVQERERQAIEEQERRVREKREKEERERREKQEGERRAREEQERREREEVERLAKEKQDRLEREQAEQAAKEEKERHEREQAEQAAKEGQERREREEADRLAQEEQERLEREQAEQAAKEGQQQREREEVERLAKEEQERLEREQTEQAAKEEQQRIEHEEAERLAKEEQEKLERKHVEPDPVEEQAKTQQNNEEELEAEEDAPEVAIEAGEDLIGDEQRTVDVEEQIMTEEVVEAEGDDIEVDAQDVSDGQVANEMVDTPEAADDEALVKDDGNLEQPEIAVEEVGVDNIQVEDEQEKKSAKEAPETQAEEPARPARPPMTGMGGMLAEIALKKKKMDATREPVKELAPRTLAPIVETKQTDSESPATALDKPEVRVTSRATGKEVLSEQFLAARQSILSLPRSENTKKILQELSATEGYHKKLEKHLNQNGIPIPSDIPYEVCKDKLASITEKMRNLHTTEQDPYLLEKKYFELEKQMAKYSTAMMLTDQWAEEQRRLAEEWEEAVKADNLIAIKQVRSHLPVNVRSMTEVELTTQPSPNGKILPKQFAKKFHRTNVLQLLRVNPEDIEKMHPSFFDNMRTTGLTLTERRALYEHMKGIGARWEAMKVDKNVERKWMWHDALKTKFKELRTAYDKHVTEYGPADAHPVAKRNDPAGGGCPLLGNQCPVKADRVLDYSEDYGYTMEAEYESSGSQKSSATKSVASNQKAEAHDLSKKKVDDEEIMALLREQLNLEDTESEADKRFLRELLHAEKRTRLLEKSLAQAGIEVPEDEIPYAEAKAKAEELTNEIIVIAGKMGSSDMKEMALLEKEYATLSSELDKYNNAMMLTKEWAAEQMEKERLWEERVRPGNQNALRMIRRHMPVNIQDMSEEALIKETTPNSKKLPQKIARKFKRTNILLLLRMDPSAIEPMHPSSLESMRTTGLTLLERRALHEHLKDLGTKWKASSKEKMAERKWMWHESLRSNFRGLVDKYDEHVEKYGPPENHPYAKRGDPIGGGCPLLGNQCPVKADLAADYSDDYGFPEDAEYRTDSVAKSNLVTMEDIKKRREEEDA